jgi:hypothetical protein
MRVYERNRFYGFPMNGENRRLHKLALYLRLFHTPTPKTPIYKKAAIFDASANVADAAPHPPIVVDGERAPRLTHLGGWCIPDTALFCKTRTTTRRFSACPSVVLSLPT